MVGQLPYENKIDLLEAENDLFIAYDQVDETENEVARTRDQIRRAKRAEGLASDEVGQAKDPASRKWPSSRWRRSGPHRVPPCPADPERANREVEEVARQCAIARYQLARLLAVRKAKIKGSEGYKPEDFERQVKTCDAEVADPGRRPKAGRGEGDPDPDRVGEAQGGARQAHLRRSGQSLRGASSDAGLALVALLLLAADPRGAQLRKAIPDESARVEAAPDDADALQRLGVAFLSLGEPEKAVAPLRELVRRDTPTPAAPLPSAAALRRGTEARAVLVAAIAAFPGDASLHAERALMARRFEETEWPSPSTRGRWSSSRRMPRCASTWPRPSTTPDALATTPSRATARRWRWTPTLGAAQVNLGKALAEKGLSAEAKDTLLAAARTGVARTRRCTTTSASS